MPQAYDFFNGADPTGAGTRQDQALAEEFGSDDVHLLDQHVFETKNYLGIPQAGARDAVGPDEPRHRERHDSHGR